MSKQASMIWVTCGCCVCWCGTDRGAATNGEALPKSSCSATGRTTSRVRDVLSGPRLRQVALVARVCDRVAGQLRGSFGWPEPFSDPGVAQFGLTNAVFAAGDTFVEVVSPVQPGTTAGRYLDRRGGDGGYMAIFQVPDLAAARGVGVRAVGLLCLIAFGCGGSPSNSNGVATSAATGAHLSSRRATSAAARSDRARTSQVIGVISRSR